MHKDFLSKAIKESAFKILGGKPRILHRVRNIKKARVLTILNFHRVSIYDGSGYPPLDPILFGRILDFLQEAYTIITFSQIKEFTSNALLKPLLILSFDDGYKDFILNAVPEMAKRGIKCNQNIVPNCVETGLPPLNVVVQDFIGKCSPEKYLSLNLTGFKWNNNNSIEKEALRVSAYLKNLTYKEQSLIFDSLLQSNGDEIRRSATAMMDIDDIKSIASVCEIGCHSFYHSNMGVETNTFFRQDLVSCTSWFNEKLGIKPNIYAFPNGSFRDEQLQLAKSEGFETVLLVGDKFTSLDNSIHCRIGMSPRSFSEAKFQVAGKLCKIK